MPVKPHCGHLGVLTLTVDVSTTVGEIAGGADGTSTPKASIRQYQVPGSM